ncbi:uncharacterized protein LOC143468680 isoform X2 [Clavelina lepadiformis]|uniref:uncharacterized protein LOC143468680 isoform X2 n=1 Tax=Clavelina lepadiformis TaxID=159417 RepID=UPI004041A568
MDAVVDSMIAIVYKCKLCDVQTSTKEALRIHIKSSHNNKLELPEILEDSENNLAQAGPQSIVEVQISNEPTIILTGRTRFSKRGRKLLNPLHHDHSYDIDNEEKAMKKKVTSSVPAVNRKRCNNPSKQKGTSKKSKVKVQNEKQPSVKDEFMDNAKEADVSGKISVEICSDPPSFKCSECEAEFLKRRLLDQHLKQIHQKTLKHCPKENCSYCSSSDREYKLHVESHFEDLFKCLMCDYTNSKWYRVKIHMQIHNDPKAHSCEECGQSFASQHALYNHRRFSHAGGNHLCDKCGFAASSKYALLQHQLTVHELIRQCSCGYKCDNAIDMASHMASRHEGGYICKHCKGGDVKFASKVELLSHTDTLHAGQKCFFCDKCNYVGKLRHHLTKHYYMHTGARPYSCSHAGCDFRTRDHRNLKQHEIMKHRKPGELVCRACRFVTTNSNDWEVHQAMYHMKEYKCKECDFKSRSTSSIRRHRLAKHTADDKKRYPCTLCPYKTNFRECLQKHLLTHTLKDNAIKCMFCSIKCNERQEMKAHISEAHPDQTVHYCGQCSYMAKRPYLIKLHERVHSLKTYSCDACDYKSRSLAQLKNHKSSQHKTETSAGGEAELSDANARHVKCNTECATNDSTNIATLPIAEESMTSPSDKDPMTSHDAMQKSAFDISTDTAREMCLVTDACASDLTNTDLQPECSSTARAQLETTMDVSS